MKVSKNIRKIVALTLAGAMTLSLASGTTAEAAKKKKAEVDLNGKYHARLGIQTATEKWIMNLGYYENVQNKYFGTENADKLMYSDSDTGEETSTEGTFEEVEIAGNGTYTVSLKDADFLGETTISQLHIATDIPMNDTIQFKNVKAKINGEQVLSFEKGVPENEEPYLEGGMVILLLNHWREALIKEVAGMGKSEDSENGYTLLKGSGKESVEITFTVEGFAYDNPDAVEATEKPTKAPATDASASGDSATEDSESGVPVLPIVVGVIAGAAIVAIVGVRMKKKK